MRVLSGGRAVATSLYSNNFAIGTAVLGHSIRSVNSTARMIMIYLEDRISEQALCINKAVGWETIPVPFIAPPHNGEGIHPRFKDQYTKLNIWSLDKLGIERLVYLDADTLVRRNFDELFELPFNFGAVPDVYGPGDPRGFSLTFNAGVIALCPSSAVLTNMKAKIQTANYPPKGAEQAFLNLYFGAKGARLPYVYNALMSIKTRSPSLWEELKEELRILHYTMVKPFLDDSHPPEKIPTLDETEAALEKAGLEQSEYTEEIEWWAAAYKRMMEEKGSAITTCLH